MRGSEKQDTDGITENAFKFVDVVGLDQSLNMQSTQKTICSLTSLTTSPPML
jgi:hypothetical protein